MEKVTSKRPINRKGQRKTDSKQEPEETTIVSETTKDETVVNENTTEVNQDNETQSKESHKDFLKAAQQTVTQEVNMDNLKTEDTSTAKVNFMSDDFMKGFMKKKTEQSQEQDKSGTTKNEEVKPEQKPQEVPIIDAKEVNMNFTESEFVDFAEIIVDIIDLGASTAMNWWSGEGSTYPYELQNDKKRKLVKQLAKILFKYQAKYSIEFMFCVTLIICYFPAFQRAKDVRAQIKAGTYVKETSRSKVLPRK